MDRRRRMRLWDGARRLTLGALLCLFLTACGGPNEEDVGTITGNPPDSGKPTVTETFPPAPTPTEPPPPFVVPIASTLFVGFGEPPLDCNGSRRTFTVSGVNPPFMVKATGGCLDPAIVGESGGEFTFIAGDEIGEFRIGITDSAGKQASADVSLRGAPAAFVRVDLAVQQMLDNGDGTFTSVIGALVSNENGNAVPDGIPVDFTIVAPDAGVSVTSPGFTHEAAPCTVGDGVVPQPGDALSCIKYARSLQGSNVRVRARIKTADGSVLEDVRTVTLPSSGETPIPTFTPTRGTPTPTPAAAFIDLDLVVNRVTDNGDGTLTTIAGALITDSRGVVVGDGIQVDFDVIDPVSGVSVTSPGVTNQPAPCTVDFTVLPQPGDALTCVKYTQSLQGQTIAIHVSVSTPQGLVEDTQTITLPDLRPTATPTITPTETPTPSATPSVTPTSTVTPTATPAAAFIALQLAEQQASDNGDGTLSAVIGALVTDANGVTIGDGVPVTFNLVAPIAGVSLTSPGFTNQAPPCTLGFTVVPQPGDALSCVKYAKSQQGTSIDVRASVSTPAGVVEEIVTIILPDFRPTATPSDSPSPTPTSTPTPTVTPTATPAAMFIAIQLAADRASDNGDGTLSTVIGAIVADANGVAVGDGVSVAFNVLAPIAGVTLTSPGFTGQPAPCTLGFTVVPQPGDALSCVKYTSNLQGTSIQVRATVSTPGGPIGVTSTIVLPDLRPPATATSTPTPTPTPTATSTPPAAFIIVDLGTDQVSDNGDGTLSTVVGALVTDARGVTIGDGVAVEFTLVEPIAGVSVTSPGFTHLQQPCTLDFTVVPQPGDALSCVKYSKSLQGFTITVRARVQTAGGPLQDTASIVLPDLRPTPTTTPTVTPTPVPTGVPFSVQFIGAEPAEIGVRASGLPEQSTLTFKVTDAISNPVSGVTVGFTLTDIDDETLVPLEAVTDENGLVQTTLTSGIRAATLRVVAGADLDDNGTADISAQSIAVSVFGAPPVLNRFSIAVEKLNVAGRRFFGIEDRVTAFVNDRFGNAVPPGTAVSFVSNGASVVDPNPTTVQGRAIATLITEEEVPTSGIVTVLAFTRGEEQFLDNNGNGVFDQGVDTLVKENLPEPFIDFRPLPPFDAGCPILPPSSLCNAAFNTNTEFELFVDENEDGIWGVQGTVGVWDNNLLIFDAIPVTFSGTLVEPLAFRDEALTIPLGNDFGMIADGGSLTFFLTVHDDLQNPLVEGSTIEVTVQGGTVFPPTITLADSQSFNQLIQGVTVFAFSVGDATPQEMPAAPPQFTSIVVNITSENGSGSFVIATGSID